jgi:hypothetical protein
MGKQESPLKEYGKMYFKSLLEESHPNIKYGDTLTFGIQFLGEDGKVLTDYTVLETIHKNEL